MDIDFNYLDYVDFQICFRIYTNGTKRIKDVILGACFKKFLRLSFMLLHEFDRAS